MARAKTLLALVALCAPAGAGVIVVDAQGGDGSVALQQAMNAAVHGDILLLKGSSFLGSKAFVAASQGITIVPDTGIGRCEIPALHLGLAPGQSSTVVLRGLDLRGTVDELVVFTALEILDSASGSVWVEDCSLTAPTIFSGDGWPAVRAGVANLVFVRSDVLGGQGAGEPFVSGGRAVQLGYAGSTLHTVILESLLQGGDMLPGLSLLPGSGGDALAAVGPIFVAGSILQGGDEGADNDAKPGKAGSAIFHLPSVPSVVHVRDSSLLPGDVIGLGQPGLPHNMLPGAFGEFAAPWRSLELPPLLREGKPGTLHVQGEVGDLVGVLVSLTASVSATLTGKQGVLLVDPFTATGVVPVGVITSADGALDASFKMPRLPVGVDGLTVFAQGVFADTTGLTTLGSASSMAWVSTAF